MTARTRVSVVRGALCAHMVLILLPILSIVPTRVHAEIYITEIMYDPRAVDSDREWIEVYNSGPDSVSLDRYLFHTGTKNKALKRVYGEMLAPGSYGIITHSVHGFESEYDTKGVLYTAVLSLSNSGSYIALIDANGNDVAHALYMQASGAHNDGNSLQRAPGTQEWLARAPSPYSGVSARSVPPVVKPSTRTSRPIAEAAKTTSSKSKKTTNKKENDSTGRNSSSSIAAVSSVMPRSTPWDMYLAFGVGGVSLVGLLYELYRRVVQAQTQWDVQDIDEQG